MPSQTNTQIGGGLDQINSELEILKSELDEILKPVIADFSPKVEYVIEQAYVKNKGFVQINCAIEEEFEDPPRPPVVADMIRHTPEFVADQLDISVSLAKALISVRYRLKQLDLEKG